MASRSISMKLRHRPSKAKQASIRQLLTENRCRACTVVITRMDFAKMFGKHNKVKIQYENLPPTVTPTRLKRNENGMVDLPRRAYSKHPVRDILSPKKKSFDNASNKSSVSIKKQSKSSPQPQQKKPKKKKNVVAKESLKVDENKAYFVSFKNNKRTATKDKDIRIKLLDLLPHVNKSVLPTPNWTMHYLPDDGEPMNDKVYDKIAAELEDLMNSGVNKVKSEADLNSDELPSIMDILNDTSKDNKCSTATEVKSELGSSDIEAMLMGSSSPVQHHQSEASQDSTTTSSDDKASQDTDIVEPGSPSIFDDKINKDGNEPVSECKPPNISNGMVKANEEAKENFKSVTHLIFKQFKKGVCSKTVTIPRNLKYKVQIEGKRIDLVAAPKTVESPNDIRNLLEILDFSGLSSDYLEVL